MSLTKAVNFTRTLLKYKEELISGKNIKEHKEYYERYFIIKGRPRNAESKYCLAI